MSELDATRVQAKVDTGGAPNAPKWQAIGFGSVWVANSELHAVQRIDPASNKIIATIKLGADSPCDGLAIGAGSLWVPGCDTGTLYRIDPATNKISAHITTPIGDGDGEGLIGADVTSVWLFVDGQGTLGRLDANTNKIVKRIALPAGSFSAILGDGAVWVTTFDTNEVERVDPTTNTVVATIPVGHGPRFEAYGEGSLWVLNQGDGTVTRIDPKTNTVSATIDVEAPGSGGCIAAGEGAAWVTMPGSPFISIDPAVNKVTGRYVGDGGDCISAGFGSVGLSNAQLGDVWRIRPTAP
jgi:virginiamycin B lyase